MTAFARVITIGKNSDMPKIVKIPVGVGVDGCAICAPITIRGDQLVCPDCQGWGTDPRWDDRCERCCGDGIVEIEQDEETSAASWCLSTAEAGRPDAGPSSGRPPSSGMMPDARATGDLSQLRPKTHTVLRSVPKPPASHSPASPHAPDKAPGISALDRIVDGLTVIAGLAVFSTLALFFLVLA